MGQNEYVEFLKTLVLDFLLVVLGVVRAVHGEVMMVRGWLWVQAMGWFSEGNCERVTETYDDDDDDDEDDDDIYIEVCVCVCEYN